MRVRERLFHLGPFLEIWFHLYHFPLTMNFIYLYLLAALQFPNICFCLLAVVRISSH